MSSFVKSSPFLSPIVPLIPEIDFISGVVSSLGKKHGIKTPLNDLMYKMIKVKEGMYS